MAGGAEPPGATRSPSAAARACESPWRLRTAWGPSWGRVPVPAGRRLPPRPSWLAPVAIALVPWARLLHRQRPSPQLHPIDLDNRHASLDGVRHLDKGKPARAPRLPIGDDPDTLNDAIRFEQLAQFVLCSHVREIGHINVHGHLLMVGRCVVAPWRHTAPAPPAAPAHSAPTRRS